jgi:large subunit ribosomal protein L9
VIGVARVKVVLREPVEKLGDPGDIVAVSGGYARNFLIPRGLAVIANKGNVKQAEDWAKSRGAQEAKARSSAETFKTKLEAGRLQVTAQAGPDGRLFGSITANDISEALASQMDAKVGRHDIQLPEPIRHLGVHEVRVALGSDVAATVVVEVSAAG